MSYLTFAYQGRSMSGTFEEGDFLVVAPIHFEAVRPGDVIAFLELRSDPPKKIAHRVQKRTAAGLVTRGDAVFRPDTHIVTSDNLFGLVCFVQRNGKVRPVQRGIAGQLWATYLLLRWKIKRLGRLPYRLLRASGLLRRLWRPRLNRVHIVTEEGPLVKYVDGTRTVACWWPEKNCFWCRKPYDLVIEHPGLADRQTPCPV